MKSDAATVDEYLASLADDRREAISQVRSVILKNLPAGYEERMCYGMISYVIPHSIYPAGYHCDPKQPVTLASLASQKNYMALYLMCVYGNQKKEEWFREEYAKTGKRLDMGKSCVRFKKIEDLALDVIGGVFAQTPVEQYLACYVAAVASIASRKKK
ncbi:MAG: DUF1801 domain-containing protein [Fimbriimonadaceae bacterium]